MHTFVKAPCKTRICYNAEIYIFPVLSHTVHSRGTDSSMPLLHGKRFWYKMLDLVSSSLQLPSNFHDGWNLKPSLGLLWENLHERGEVLDSHRSCKTEDKEEDVGEHRETGRNLPVLQQQGHPANLPRLVWRVPRLTQVLAHKAEVPCKNRLHVAEGVEGVLPVIATHSAGTYSTKWKSLYREMDNSVIKYQRPRAGVVLEIFLGLLFG